MYDILIPTNKSREALIYYERMLKNASSFADNIFISAQENCSASTNRNVCLYSSSAEYAVMIDDDLYRLDKGVLDDFVKNFKRLEEEEKAVIASARLLKPDKSFGIMMNLPIEIHKPYQIIKQKALPTACIVFNLNKIKKAEIFFDEAFYGSGWEDTDFCMQIKKAFPDGNFYIDNKVKVIHLNEMKNQKGKIYQRNKQYFLNKWNASSSQKKEEAIR